MQLNQTQISNIIKESISKSLKENIPARMQTKVQQAKTVLKEAVILIPKSYVLKTEMLSGVVKEAHFKIYKSLVDSFNSISSKLDSVNKEDAQNPNDSVYRRLKLDEQNCLNGVKLHELCFTNISDLHSEIRLDSLPYLRLAKDWGTFDNWQFDFRACALATNEGWAVCYYDPYKQKYINCIVEGNTVGIPICGVPVLVLDCHGHAWYRDYPGAKMEYVNSMMKEFNWSVVEARIVVAERSNLQNLYAIQPAQNNESQKMLNMLPTNQPPIDSKQIVNTGVVSEPYPSGAPAVELPPKV